MSGGFDRASTGQALLEERGDPIAFGRPFPKPLITHRFELDQILDACGSFGACC